MRRTYQIPLSHEDVFRGDVSERIPYHRMYGKQYCLPQLMIYGREEAALIASAAERIDIIYRKALRFAQRHLADDFLENHLGIPLALIPAARIEVPYHGVSRQDWILNEGRLKCIENNMDTPSGIPETAWLSGRLIEEYGKGKLSNPSAGMKAAIQPAFRNLLEFYCDRGLDGLIAFSCYDWHVEDKTNTLYLYNVVREMGYEAAYVPLDKLEIALGEGLYSEGRRIDVLYRLYPLEYLIHDKEEETELPIGEELLRLVEQGKLGLINPVQSIITQSKGFMALVWSLFERNHLTEEAIGYSLFNEEELATMESYLLPTYFEKSVFEASALPYVSKGYWGREGKGVKLHDSSGQVEALAAPPCEEDEEVHEYYDKQPKVYQLRCSMEQVSVPTEEGEFAGYLLTGAYVIGGRYAGLLPRVGEAVTGDMAYFCPAAMEIKGELVRARRRFNFIREE